MFQVKCQNVARVKFFKLGILLTENSTLFGMKTVLLIDCFIHKLWRQCIRSFVYHESTYKIIFLHIDHNVFIPNIAYITPENDHRSGAIGLGCINRLFGS